MQDKHNPKLVTIARILRRNMTKEERKLWYDFLHTYPVKFTRQKVLGKYVVDFYCAKAKLVVELDGSGHFTARGKIEDAERTSFLSEYDLRVIRISNLEINTNFKGVCDYLDHAVQERILLLQE